MSKENLTIRIAINKPEPETAETEPKKKSALPFLIALLVLPILSLGLYQLIKPKPEIKAMADSSISQASLPASLNEPEPRLLTDDANTVITHSLAPAPTSPAQKLKTPPALPANQILAHRSRKISSSSHNIPISKQTLEEGSQSGNVATTQLIHALPAFLQRAQLSTGIIKREPQNTLKSQVKLSDLPENRLYMFTELHGKAGQIIHHRWIYKNQIMANVPIKVGANRWRCYSSKQVNKDSLGQWVVEITDENGKVLYTQTIHLNS
ncbi:MAG: DUF2914 domain-containing protein [Pseudomonadales bacterium]|nr:DUF2914 domain-containing protein [Pseudomonadales bacterium]